MELKLLLNISLFYADNHMCDYYSMVIKFQSPSQLKKLEEKYLVPLGGVCSGQVGGVVGSCDWDWEASSTKSSMMVWQLSLRLPILLLGIKSLIRSISMFWLALLHSASICVKSTAKKMKNTGFLWYASHLWNMLYVLEKYRFLLSVTANNCTLYYMGSLICIS